MRRCASIRPATLAVAIITALALSLTTMSALAGTLNPIKLRISGKEVALRTPAVYDGREVYLPLDALTALGATYTLGRRDETAVVTLPNGLKTEVALARPGKQPMVPLSTLAKPLGIVVIVKQNMCDVRREGERPALEKIDPPARSETSRPIVEKRAPLPLPVELNDSHAIGAARISRPAFDKKPPIESRIVVPLPPGKFGLNKSNAYTNAKAADQGAAPPQNIQPSGALDNTGSPATTLPRPGATPPGPLASRGAVNPRPAVGVKPFVAAVRIEDVAFETTGMQSARIRIRTVGKAQATTRLLGQPSRLAIDVPNAVIEGDQRDWNIEHPFLSGIHAVDGETPGSTRFVLDLSRLITYRLLPPDANGITINFGLPQGVGRKISELVVVVDPGHGGSEGKNPVGCSIVCAGQCIMEKQLTLSIAKRVQRLLEEEGATVLMTRTKDVAIPLTDRPRIAIQNNADLFVSIHVDDCPRPNSASGTTAYYSKDDPNGRALAHSIVENIAAVSGLPNRRARSDRERFVGTGMAVLHTGAIPSTLVEIGYINNVNDRTRLINPEFQDTIAQAIVEGIRGYVEASLVENVAGPTGVVTPVTQMGMR